MSFSLEFISTLVGKAIASAIETKIKPALNDLAIQINEINSSHRKRIEALEMSWAGQLLDEMFAKKMKELEQKFDQREIGRIVERAIEKESGTRVERQLRLQVDAMKKDLDLLFDRGVLFEGVWERDSLGTSRYRVGNIVVHRGSMWVCHRPHPETPGTEGSGWTLAQKNH